jgi:hypothetical protein
MLTGSTINASTLNVNSTLNASSIYFTMLEGSTLNASTLKVNSTLNASSIIVNNYLTATQFECSSIFITPAIFDTIADITTITTAFIIKLGNNYYKVPIEQV